MASSSAPASEPFHELFLIWSVQDGGRLPHWMLMVVPPLNEAQRLGQVKSIIKGTRYHSSGGPTEGVPYRVAIQANTNFRSENVRNREHLCNIKESDVVKLAKLAGSIQPHQCQKYVVCMLALMEKRMMTPTGIAESLASRVAMSKRALDYEAAHSAPRPVGITLPPSWPMPATAGGPRR
ncbi:hypothetical protein HD806DRAFT_463700 [Xylariaceae sp. AK1471]|nr:hypothetical protein HD806DRAFT_463700 [Xylariaceae sp. AK1471]